MSSKQYGSLLIPVIMSRMPAEITLQIARKTSQDVWEVDEIMKIILADIEALEVSEKVRISEKGSDKLRSKFNMPTGTTKAFVTSTRGGVVRRSTGKFPARPFTSEKIFQISVLVNCAITLRFEVNCLRYVDLSAKSSMVVYAPGCG